ncbi:MAG: FkbM family methyltransferase [Pseudomonadota bacterium]
MRRLVHSLRKRLLRLSPEPRRVDRLGATWELHPRDWLDARLLIRQPFEAEQRARFAAMLAARRPTRLFDIGANFGLYAITSALADPALQVDAFEPVSRTRAKLLRNLALNGLQDRVRIHPIALSDAEGEARIAIDPRSSGLSTLSASAAEAARRDFSEAQTVRTAPLDALFQLRGETLALKIDVEGHEPATLAGASALLAENAGVAMVEIRDRNIAQVQAAFAAAEWRETGRIADELFFEK